MKLLNRLERKLLSQRIVPFIRYFIFAMLGVYLLQMFFPRYPLISLLQLSRAAVLRGEVWRLLTFLIVPPLNTPMFTLLSLYFYYFIGSALEARWGTRRFFLYFVFGTIGAILAALITGRGTNTYLYMSMFFAYAILNPNQELLLFFMIPVKIKWLALLNAAFYVYGFIIGSWDERAAILLSLAHVFLFFGGDLITLFRQQIDYLKARYRFRNYKR